MKPLQEMAGCTDGDSTPRSIKNSPEEMAAPKNPRQNATSSDRRHRVSSKRFYALQAGHGQEPSGRKLQESAIFIEVIVGEDGDSTVSMLSRSTLTT
jgi:hypothetical protein